MPGLAQDREWLPEDHKWRLLLAVGTVYGLHDEAGDRNSTTVMVHGGPPLPGDRSRWFIPLMQALG